MHIVSTRYLVLGLPTFYKMSIYCLVRWGKLWLGRSSNGYSLVLGTRTCWRFTHVSRPGYSCPTGHDCGVSRSSGIPPARVAFFPPHFLDVCLCSPLRGTACLPLYCGRTGWSAMGHLFLPCPFLLILRVRIFCTSVGVLFSLCSAFCIFCTRGSRSDLSSHRWCLFLFCTFSLWACILFPQFWLFGHICRKIVCDTWPLFFEWAFFPPLSHPLRHLRWGSWWLLSLGDLSDFSGVFGPSPVLLFSGIWWFLKILACPSFWTQFCWLCCCLVCVCWSGTRCPCF